MITIKLSRTWLVEDDKPLGSPGGFGSVFCGKSEDGEEAAIKLFHVNRVEKASRELSLAKYLCTSPCPHVIPILDSGPDEYTGAYVIVMARASGNLQKFIEEQAPLEERAALEIIEAIAQGLQEIGGIVHRDLKPANILRHANVWKIADLGLARFLDASTSLNTMKDFLSAPYAAPELWRGERPTKAADVYSLGCITYALLTGHPPFDGPERDDYRQQHELLTPPDLPASDRLKQLTSRSLSKAAALRPPIDSYRIQLANIRSPKPVLKSAGLAQAAATLAARRAKLEAEVLQRKQKKEERQRVSDEATVRATEILKGLIDLIKTEAPDAKLETDKASTHYFGSEKLELVLGLGSAFLVCDIVCPFVEEGAFGKTWDLYCLGRVEVTSGGIPPRGRSANLAFGSIAGDPHPGWWELGFKLGPSEKPSDSAPPAPFSLGHGHSASGYRMGGSSALSGGGCSGEGETLKYGWYVLAHNPKRIDVDNFESFHQRWIDFFSTMAVTEFGSFHQPPLPEEHIEPKFVPSW